MRVCVEGGERKRRGVGKEREREEVCRVGGSEKVSSCVCVEVFP